jgi:transcriptional regulator with XRE-family HTH domain
MEYFQMAFADNLKRVRNDSGLSQGGLADKSGLSVRTIQGLEQGRRDPSWSVAQALADALECSLDDFRDRPAKSVKQ